jgi:SAM-dependent methyltransferase
MRTLDTLLADRGGEWWSDFFADRSRAIPFFASWPDENLAGWLDDGQLTPGRVLELGCGNGRNAVHLASRGCQVDAVDYSQEAIGWARERADAAGVPVGFQCCSIFDAQIEAGAYDLVYDSGCFHHLAPHRRQDYFGLITAALKPGGSFGLVCFRPEGGSGLTDLQVYEKATLGGGLGFTADQLRLLWDRAPFSVRVLRQMEHAAGPWFGEDFLWALLAVKDGG